MGFGLKRTLRKAAPFGTRFIDPFDISGIGKTIGGKLNDGSGGGGGPDYGFQDPNKIADEERKFLESIYGQEHNRLQGTRYRPSSLMFGGGGGGGANFDDNGGPRSFGAPVRRDGGGSGGGMGGGGLT